MRGLLENYEKEMQRKKLRKSEIMLMVMRKRDNSNHRNENACIA